jgi:hypothetical protein
MAQGPTVGKYTKFQIEDSGGTMRDLPVTGWGNMGLTYEEVDVSSFQELLKGQLVNQGGMTGVTITGPFTNTAAQAASGSGAAPVLSGSHTVLSALNGANTPRSFGAYLGIQGYWATGDPVFGGIDCCLISDYTVTEDGKYSAKLCLAGNRTNDPAWGTAAIAASS